MDHSVYSLSIVSMHDIFAKLFRHSYGFENKTLNGFSSSCGKSKATFLEKKEIRNKRKDTQSFSTQRYRELYVMKPQYYEATIKDMVEYRSRYHQYLRDQKNQGIEIIGYALKSQGRESLADRTRLLQRMVDNLRDRSLVDHVYASPSSSAGEKLANRDDNGVTALEGTDGTTQKLI